MRCADDELVIKLSEVGAAAHLQSLERPRQAQFPVPNRGLSHIWRQNRRQPAARGPFGVTPEGG